MNKRYHQKAPGKAGSLNLPVPCWAKESDSWRFLGPQDDPWEFLAKTNFCVDYKTLGRLGGCPREMDWLLVTELYIILAWSPSKSVYIRHLFWILSPSELGELLLLGEIARLGSYFYTSELQAPARNPPKRVLRKRLASPNLPSLSFTKRLCGNGGVRFESGRNDFFSSFGAGRRSD